MTKGENNYTATMAKVYAEQGYLEKAAEIYKSLLEKEPEKTDIMNALSEIEKKLVGKKADTKNLVSIFCRWIDLAEGYGRLQKLKKFRSRLEGLILRKD